MSFLKVVPLDCILKVDNDFVRFVTGKLKGRRVQKWEKLHFSIFFAKVTLGVVDCSPEEFQIDETTQIQILPKLEQYHTIFNPIALSNFTDVLEKKPE